MEIVSLGDSALVVRVSNDFAAAPEEALRAVVALQQKLEQAAIPGVVEYAPGYASLAVFFDPAAVAGVVDGQDDSFKWLQRKIRAAALRVEDRATGGVDFRIHQVPVCYDDPEFALDLAAVVQHTRLSAADVVARHSEAEYRVHCVGFLPGFPYLGGLPRELAMPRRATPRSEVRAGSVAIGGAQTGIYPANSPGGWNVIGRTPLRLFDPAADPPARFRAGDRLRFVPITRAEFDR